MKFYYDIDGDFLYFDDEESQVDSSKTFELENNGTAIIEFNEKGRVSGVEVHKATHLFDIDAEQLKKLAVNLQKLFDEKREKKSYFDRLELIDNMEKDTEKLENDVEKDIYSELKARDVNVQSVQKGHMVDLFFKNKVEMKDIEEINDLFDDMEVVEVFLDKVTFEKDFVCVTVAPRFTPVEGEW